MTSLIDIGINTLTLDGKTFTLLSKAGEGGSSIVYKARPIDASEYYMIKEFYPHNLVTGREADGTVLFDVERNAFTHSLKERVLREAEIASKLRHDDEDENNNPWFLGYSKPIPANNTLYTVSKTETGKTLHEKIYGDYYSDKCFAVLCDCILDILKAIEPIHSKGYLHLDISPDNIYCSNVMRMIDYNSAYFPSDHSEEFFPSFKKGYSAPELKKGMISSNLSFATDLYSVAAIFFTLLKNRPLEGIDGVNPFRWLLTDREGCLKGASKLLVDKTNTFLRKNLAKIPALRSQRVTEMREQIEELKKLAQRIELTSKPKRPNPHFVCRSSEIEAIDEQLKKDSYVLLEGIGGIGKTELAKKYAWDNRDKYDIIQFVTYAGDLQTTIAYSLEFRNFDNIKALEYDKLYGKEAVKYIFRDKMNYLQQKENAKTLIIVDNYNTVFDDHFTEFTSGEYKVIFTSREKHSGSVIEVTEMKNEEDLLTLFREYYPKNLSEEQEIAVREIIRLVLGHTMTLMLIATAMLKSELTPGEMLARLQDGLDPKLRTKIAVDKEELSAKDRENIVYEHIRNLFDMEDIISNENYAFILANMAIVPYAGLEKKLFYNWALFEHYKGDEYDDEDYTDVNWLIDRRWIKEEIREDVRYVSLHPVISDLAYRELRPDSVKCGKLIEGMIEFANNCINKTYIEQTSGLEMLELACKRVSDETELTAAIYGCSSLFLCFLGDYDLSFDYMQRSLLIITKLFGENSFQYAGVSLQIGILFMEKLEYDQAYIFFNKALEIYILDKNRPYLVASVYNSLGDLYMLTEDYKKAESYYRKSIAICKAKRRKRNYCMVIYYAYQSMGILCDIAGEKDKASIYLNNALALSKVITDNNSIFTACAYNSLHLGNFDLKDEKEIETLLTALDINRKVFGENHHSTIYAYYNLGSYYMEKEDFSKAVEIFSYALNSSKGTTVTAKRLNMFICDNIAHAYCFLGDKEKMIDYFRRGPEIDLALSNEEVQTGPAYMLMKHGSVLMKEHPSKAMDLFIEALAMQIQIFGEDHPETIRIRLPVGYAFKIYGNKEVALMQYKKIQEIYRNLDHEKKFVYKDYFELAELLAE